MPVTCHLSLVLKVLVKKQRENERKKEILEGKCRKHSTNTSLEVPALDYRNFLEVETPTAA